MLAVGMTLWQEGSRTASPGVEAILYSILDMVSLCGFSIFCTRTVTPLCKPMWEPPPPLTHGCTVSRKKRPRQQIAGIRLEVVEHSTGIVVPHHRFRVQESDGLWAADRLKRGDSWQRRVAALKAVPRVADEVESPVLEARAQEKTIIVD